MSEHSEIDPKTYGELKSIFKSAPIGRNIHFPEQVKNKKSLEQLQIIVDEDIFKKVGTFITVVRRFIVVKTTQLAEKRKLYYITYKDKTYTILVIGVENKCIDFALFYYSYNGIGYALAPLFEMYGFLINYRGVMLRTEYTNFCITSDIKTAFDIIFMDYDRILKLSNPNTFDEVAQVLITDPGFKYRPYTSIHTQQSNQVLNSLITLSKQLVNESLISETVVFNNPIKVAKTINPGFVEWKNKFRKHYKQLQYRRNKHKYARTKLNDAFKRKITDEQLSVIKRKLNEIEIQNIDNISKYKVFKIYKQYTNKYIQNLNREYISEGIKNRSNSAMIFDFARKCFEIDSDEYYVLLLSFLVITSSMKSALCNDIIEANNVLTRNIDVYDLTYYDIDNVLGSNNKISINVLEAILKNLQEYKVLCNPNDGVVFFNYFKENKDEGVV